MHCSIHKYLLANAPYPDPRPMHACQRRMEMVPGMTFTIEPIFTEGSEATLIWRDGWTVQTVDGGRAAQFEHVVLVTEEGHEVLTVSAPPTP